MSKVKNTLGRKLSNHAINASMFKSNEKLETSDLKQPMTQTNKKQRLTVSKIPLTKGLSTRPPSRSNHIGVGLSRQASAKFKRVGDQSNSGIAAIITRGQSKLEKNTSSVSK